MRSAPTWHAAWDIDAGTMICRTPDRSLAATVRRRRRVARMRMGGRKDSSALFKDVGSDVCGDGFGPIVGSARSPWEPSLLRPSESQDHLSTIPTAMPRSVVIGNGNVLVGFDTNYTVRDIYYPRVGDTNQTMGNPCRTG